MKITCNYVQYVYRSRKASLISDSEAWSVKTSEHISA